MDKYILHSLLQDKVAKGSIVNIKFCEPFASYSGKYLVNESKTGRGRGGSRVIELQAVDSGLRLTTFYVDGKDKLIGTAVSEYFDSIEIDSVTYADITGHDNKRTASGQADDTKAGQKATRGSTIRSLATELAPVRALVGKSATSPGKRTIAANRARRGLATPAEKLADSLKDPLATGSATVIRLQAFSANSHMNGDWVVNEYRFTDNEKLIMELTDIDNPTRTFTFNAAAHAQQVREVDIVNDV